MQQVLQKIFQSDSDNSVPAKRLLKQGNYSTVKTTETLHVEWIASIAVGKILKELTYFAEGDGMNVIFGMHKRVSIVSLTLDAITNANITTDIITLSITKLHEAGHLIANDLQFYIKHAHDAVLPAVEYWGKKVSAGGSYFNQCRLYEAAHYFNPEICAGCDVLIMRHAYAKLEHFKFPKDIVKGLQDSAQEAIVECADIVIMNDIVNFWDQRSERFPHHASAVKRLALFQPSEASCERVFSRLKSHFSRQQMNRSLNDMVEVGVMLDYNQRDISNAWEL